MRARDNPFSTNRVEGILQFDPALMGESWDEIDSRWLKLNKRAALIGPHGAGKTTFIDSFSQRLVDQGAEVLRIFLNSESPRISSRQWKELTKATGKIIILDGEEQLNQFQRWRFHRLTEESGGLLISRHSQGKLPIMLEFTPKIETLFHCVRKLAPEYYPQLEPDLDQWWQDDNGNIRLILLRCYDYVAAHS